MKLTIAFCLFFSGLALAGCGGGDDDGSNGGPVAAEWSYEGDNGPAHWGDLSAAYATCSEGIEQSPIDIHATPSLDPALEIEYSRMPLVISNNGHTIEVEYHEGGTLTVGAHTWEVVQFHFHAHGEHTVEGVAAPLELHIVHRDENGGLAVLGVLIEEGAENEALAPVFDHLPGGEGEPQEIEGVEIDLGDALPESLAAWRYDGSLTTPPCSEGVRWHVLSNPIEASAAQIGAFETRFDHNYRPTQPLNGRTID